jgi:hypothetical protein
VFVQTATAVDTLGISACLRSPGETEGTAGREFGAGLRDCVPPWPAKMRWRPAASPRIPVPVEQLDARVGAPHRRAGEDVAAAQLLEDAQHAGVPVSGARGRSGLR